MSDTPSDLDTRTSLLRQLVEPEKREEAWRAFTHQYLPMIERWCRAKGLQPADVQEASSAILLKLVRAMPSFVYRPELAGFRPWLRTVVENTLRNFWRDRAKDPKMLGSAIDELIQHPKSAADESTDQLVDSIHCQMEAIHRRVQHALAAAREVVEPTTWQVFEAAVLQGKTGPEVAALLNIQIGKVYVYKKRMLDRIRKFLQENA